MPQGEKRIPFDASGQPELHVTGPNDDPFSRWNVWLNTGIADFDGLCIGAHEDREKAIQEAVAVLYALHGKLMKELS